MPPRRSLFNQPLTIRRTVAGVDEYGNEVRTPGQPTQMLGYLEQSSSVEHVDDRDMVVTSWRLFLPADAQIDALDVVEFEGNTWQVVGNPDRKWNPRTRRAEYVRAELTAVQEGAADGQR